MRQKGFRQNFTQSFATLPLVALVTAAVWMLPNLSSLRLGGGLLATALMTYVVIECNNRYHLLRVRSRMNSVVFLVLMAAFPTLHDLGLHLIPAAALLLAYFVLFRAYGQTRTQGTLFHTTLLLSLGSLAFPQLIVVIPFLLFVAAVQLRALNLSAFGGALLGAVLPYWIYLAVPLRFRLDACSGTTLGTAPSAADFCLCRCSPLPLGGLRRSDCARHGGHGAFFLLIL